MAVGVLDAISSRTSISSAFDGLGAPTITPDAGLKFNAYLSTFFDRKSVIDALNKAELSVLSKFGAFLRQTAKTSIRKSNKRNDPSPAGSPPRSHDKRTPDGGRAKHLLREMMFFGYDSQTKSAVVGPATINKATGAPSYCEFGGKATRPKRGGGYVTVTYPKRSFMAPALAKEAPKFPQLFKGSFGGQAVVSGPGG